MHSRQVLPVLRARVFLVRRVHISLLCFALLRFALLRSSGASELRLFFLGLVKYLVAGAILAWRLS